MLLWRWTKLTLLTFLMTTSIHALAAPSSEGPTSPEEARILWADGKKAFEESNFQDAVNSLQRFVDRYPGHEGYLEAHRLLGRSLMQLGKSSSAYSYLEKYIAATHERELGLRTRLWLGVLQLSLQKNSQAYLTATEIQKLAGTSNPELYAESQFLRSRALIRLRHDDRAEKVLDSIESSTAVQSDSKLRAEAAQTRIELKLRRCEKYPPRKSSMDELQARDEFAKRALCLQEALTLFKTAADSGELLLERETADQLIESFESYARATRQPPSPLKMDPPRTEEQTKQYRLELVDRLEEDRKKTVRETLSMLNQWKEKTSIRLTKNYSDLASRLEKLR